MCFSLSVWLSSCLSQDHSIIQSVMLVYLPVCLSICPLRVQHSPVRMGVSIFVDMFAFQFKDRKWIEAGRNRDYIGTSDRSNMALLGVPDRFPRFRVVEGSRDQRAQYRRVPGTRSPKIKFFGRAGTKNVMATFCEINSGLYYTRMACTLNMIMINHNWWL